QIKIIIQHSTSLYYYKAHKSSRVRAFMHGSLPFSLLRRPISFSPPACSPPLRPGPSAAGRGGPAPPEPQPRASPSHPTPPSPPSLASLTCPSPSPQHGKASRAIRRLSP